jgi:putative spermidine/putrescine transport system substrate-binding protein
VKRNLLFLILLSTALLVAACGSSENNSSMQSNPTDPNQGMYAGPVGDSENNLNVLVWPGYAEDGNTDPVIDGLNLLRKTQVVK